MAPDTNRYMLKKISENLEQNIIEKPYAVGTLILIETGIIIVLFSAYFSLSNNSNFFVLFGDVGKAIIVTSFVGYIYNSLIKIHSITDLKVINDSLERSSNETQKFIMKCIEDGRSSTIECIEDGRRSTFSDSFINCFLDSDLVTNKGLVKVHASRRSALNSFVNKVDQIKDQGEVNIYLCGITLREFFRSDGICYDLFKDWLRKVEKLKARVIIIDKKSQAAVERAMREDPDNYHPENNRLSHELEDTEATIQHLLQSSDGKKINVKKSTISPLCFLAVVNDTMIMEPYNYANSGGKAPVFEFRLSNNDDLFNTYMKHFISLWIKPCNRYENGKVGDLRKHMSDKKSVCELCADLPWNEDGQIEFCKEEQK